jgi:phage terminase large subunit
VVNVLGEFPPTSINALLGVEEVEEAMPRHLRIDQYDWAQKRLGVDVVRFGDDRTVIFPRQGLASFRPVVMRNARTTDIAARVMVGMKRWGAELAIIDDTGHWGHGVIDNLAVAGVPCVGINYAGKALNPRYKNRRAEMWIKGGGSNPARRRAAAAAGAGRRVDDPDVYVPERRIVLDQTDKLKNPLGRSGANMAKFLAGDFDDED